MKILVESCDSYNDTWLPFHYCVEKYWPNHPEIIYSTETKINPYYKTICLNYPLEKWSTRIADTARQIDDNQILLLCDDLFIRNPVNEDKLKILESYVVGDVAAFNFHEYNKAMGPADIKTDCEWINQRNENGLYKTSVMCQLWQKDKLLDVFDTPLSPHNFEMANTCKNYKYLINAGEPIIYWGRKSTGGAWGVFRGKWCRESQKFFKQEGLEVDFSKREFYD